MLVATACGLWVRPAELITAPISAPIAFVVGLLPASGGGDGFSGRLMGVFTALALHAGWLYGGTLAAALVVWLRRAARAGAQPEPRP
ncbi:DUF6542 domain-containing protein [Streptomyces sp. URMC 123]|uniref:DUF6542 domain-containing protein n=1 Tax=Streptomyces sp. URMC 123 TaxID=3423403 RepID=UPI003F1A0DBF